MVSKAEVPFANDVTSYLKTIFSLERNESAVRCYRGHADKSWKLLPSVMRGLLPDAENRILSELMIEAPAEFSFDKLMFEKLVRAQHYGLPTRLLDVSMNPLVALFFACQDEENSSSDACVKIIDFTHDRVKFADSDTISIISNLARLSDEEKSSLYDLRPTKRLKDHKKIFRESEEMQRLTQFVRVEKPYFLDIVNPHDLFRYYFVYPSKNNRRIISQSGAFVASGLLKYQNPDASLDIRQIVVKSENKRRILSQLDELNINTRALFPEIEHTSHYIKQKWHRPSENRNKKAT